MNRVIESSYKVSRHSSFVRINTNKYSRINEYSDLLKTISDQTQDDTDVDFAVLFSSLNFCFWHFDETKSSNTSEARQRFMHIYKLGKIRSLDFQEFETIIGPLYLNQKRFDFIQESVSFIDSVEGKVLEYLNSFDSIKELIADIVLRMPQYNDVSIYKGDRVYLYKRVQSLIFSLRHLIKRFNAETELSALADYRVPQFLNTLGILEYSDDLMYRIENNIEIQHDSEEEIEIRANTVVAVHEIASRLDISPAVVDNLIWKGGKLVQNKNNFHKTINFFY